MPEQNFSKVDLPARVDREDISYLIPSDEWRKLQGYMKLITIKDDGGDTTKVEETKQGLVLKRVN